MIHRFKATRKEMRRSADCIIPAGYYKLHYLLRFRQSPAYSSGPMGWSCDYYPINHPDNTSLSILISTGYRPLGSKGLSVSDAELSATIKDYNEKAKRENAEETENLLKEFIREVVVVHRAVVVRV